MADRLVRGNLTTVRGALRTRGVSAGMMGVIALMVAAMQTTVAEELLDPTRPPDGIAVFAGYGSAGIAPPVSRGLQIVFISKTRRAAVIDGRTIELGGKYGDASLIEVNESGVVLQGPHGRKTVMLFPKVKMTKVEMKTELPVAESTAETGESEHKPVVQEERK